MYRAGLLILTQPLSRSKQQIPDILEEVSKLIKETLYVHIQPNTHRTVPRDWTVTQVPCTTEVQSYIREFYSKSVARCMTLDVRILLGHITNSQVYRHEHKLTKGYETVVFDSFLHEAEHSSELLKTVQKFYPVVPNQIPIQYLKSTQKNEQLSSESTTDASVINTYDNVVLGGTFDRLHGGHKIFINEGCFYCDKKLTVGVSDGDMNKKKVLVELLEPVEERKRIVKELIQDMKPQIMPDVVTITDAFGPTITDPDLQYLILTEEVRKGGAMINDERKKRGMQPLGEEVIYVLEDPCREASEETKVSSSSLRRRLLGTLYHPIQVTPNIPTSPYRIGLTGGTCSGKSTICKNLAKLGAGIVDCDKLGHEAYRKDTKAYKQILEEFGNDIVTQDGGEIDRRKLAPIVFSDKTKLNKLNSIVWPEIAELAEQQIIQFNKDGVKVVILDAAVLLEASWNKMVHEVWTSLVPQPEAVKRIMERNSLSEEEAVKRVTSQISNQSRVDQSNVIFCSLWEYEYTQSQVNKAWHLLQERIQNSKAAL